jgi:hypothetical protein
MAFTIAQPDGSSNRPSAVPAAFSSEIVIVEGAGFDSVPEI